MPTRSCLGWAGVALLSWSSVGLADEAEALVERMIEATRRLDYAGIFVYQRDGNLETLRVLHRGSTEPEMERLESLNGPARGVLREGEKVTVRATDDAAVMLAGSPPPLAPNFSISGSLAELAPSYQFELKPDLDRVAGRGAQVVNVRPRMTDRYAYRLWIDQQTGLLLKSVIMDAQERPLEQEQFATVDIGVTLDDAVFKAAWGGTAGAAQAADLQSETASVASVPVPPVPDKPAMLGWNVGWLPAGFTQHGESPQANGPAPHFVYSDGLATVAVFVERIVKEATPLQGYSFMGAVSTFSRVLAEHQITVIGELPQATVRRIALSISPQSSAGQH